MKQVSHGGNANELPDLSHLSHVCLLCCCFYGGSFHCQKRKRHQHSHCLRISTKSVDFFRRPMWFSLAISKSRRLPYLRDETSSWKSKSWHLHKSVGLKTDPGFGTGPLEETKEGQRAGGGCRKETPPKGHKAAVFRGRKHVAEGPEIIEFQWFKRSQPLSTIMFKQAIISQLLQSMWQCAYSPPCSVQYVLPCLCILHMGSCLYYTFLCKRLSGSPCCGIVKTNSCLFNVSGWWIDFNLM